MVSANGVGCGLAGGDGRGQTSSLMGVGIYIYVLVCVARVMVWNGIGEDNGLFSYKVELCWCWGVGPMKSVCGRWRCGEQVCLVAVSDIADAQALIADQRAFPFIFGWGMSGILDAQKTIHLCWKLLGGFGWG